MDEEEEGRRERERVERTWLTSRLKKMDPRCSWGERV